MEAVKDINNDKLRVMKNSISSIIPKFLLGTITIMTSLNSNEKWAH